MFKCNKCNYEISIYGVLPVHFMDSDHWHCPECDSPNKMKEDLVMKTEIRVLRVIPDFLDDPSEIRYVFVNFMPSYEYKGQVIKSSYSAFDINCSSIKSLEDKLEELKEALNKPVIQEFRELKELK